MEMFERNDAETALRRLKHHLNDMLDSVTPNQDHVLLLRHIIVGFQLSTRVNAMPVSKDILIEFNFKFIIANINIL
jgi:hypothetical protein